MMRRVFLFLFGFIVSLVAHADQVTEQQALQKAQQFMKGKNLTVSYSRSFARPDSPKDNQAFYIFNAENDGGFVIISGDDRTPAILGYSDQGSMDLENLPDNVRYWLEGYATQINALQEGKSFVRTIRTQGDLPAIEPLIKTQWGQSEPYNSMCPMDGESRSKAGHTASLAAQILFYHQWPESSPSLPSYTTRTKKIDVPELPETTFNYDLMRKSYSQEVVENDPSRDEVAKLFRYCGQAMEMDYAATGSAAYLTTQVLRDVFRYTWRARAVSRESYSDEVWDQMMYDELQNGRPVLYYGRSETSVNQFILDGYKDELFHINWGLGSCYIGYFILSLCNPYQSGKNATDAGYYKNQSAVINLAPGKNEKKVTVGSLQYICDTKEKIAVVVRGDYSEMAEAIIPASIKDGGITYQVTEIDESIFNGVWYLKKVDLPSTLTAIGDHAFANCSNLTTVVCRTQSPPTINENVFSNTIWKQNEETGESVSSSEFTKATLYVPDGCTATYQKAAGWKQFPLIYEGEYKETIVDGLNYSYVSGSKIATVLSGDYSALESVTIPSTITVDGVNYQVRAIENQAFQYCYNMKSLTLSKNLERIGDYAFNVCSGIEQVTIPEGVKTIGSYAFQSCSSLKRLELPSSILDIGEYAFSWLSDLDAVVVTASEPLAINENVFSNTTWVKNEGTDEYEPFSEFTKATLYVPEGCTAIYQKAAVWKKFSQIYEGILKETTIDGLNYSYVTGSKIATVLSGDYQALESVTIPSTITVDGVKYKVTAIDNQAFTECRNLKSLTLSKNLERIGDYAFSCCYNIEQVIIPEGVKSIGIRAFQLCFFMKKLELPSSLSAIGETAFGGLSYLDSVVVTAPEPLMINESVFTITGWRSNEEIGEHVPFSEFTGATLYVPFGKKKVYEKASGWEKFTEIVEMEPTVGDLIPITIGSSGKSTYCSKYDLDFSKTDDVKAYVATGYEADGTVWLTRIKQVPAGTSVLIKGEAEKTYEMLILNKCAAYFENMFQGSADEDLGISTTTEDGMYKNFYMAGGVFKPVSDQGQAIKAGKCYLQVPANFNAAAAGENQTVKIADSGKSSYAPPVDVDLTDVEGLKAYAATGYDPASSTIWLTRINKIQAGEGVILKGEAGKTYNLPSAATQAYYGNMIIGNIGDPITINETSDDGEWKNFYLASGSFKAVSGSRTIGTNKSYLVLPTWLLVSNARGKQDANIDEWFMEELETETLLLGSIGGDDEDGTTRIDAINNDNAQPDVYYNLQGQRINNPKKGLYIRNGKKVVIK